MPDLSILATPAPYHILTYGTLLGSQFYQSFINGPVAYKAIERPHFSALQQKIFPIYFSLQTALPVILALTYPSNGGTTSPYSASSSSSSSSSLFNSSGGGSNGGFLSPSNRWSALAPIVTIFATALVNLAFVGPATTDIMLRRRRQEARDGKKSFDAPPHSEEMRKLNKAFGSMHGASSLLNLVGLIATVWYGVVLAERLN